MFSSVGCEDKEIDGCVPLGLRLGVFYRGERSMGITIVFIKELLY